MECWRPTKDTTQIASFKDGLDERKDALPVVRLERVPRRQLGKTGEAQAVDLHAQFIDELACEGAALKRVNDGFARFIERARVKNVGDDGAQWARVNGSRAANELGAAAKRGNAVREVSRGENPGAVRRVGRALEER